MKLLLKLCYFLSIFLFVNCTTDGTTNVLDSSTFSPATVESSINPYTSNPKYWKYNGKPVMLLGGSQDDNLFQISNLKQHLNTMEKVGANYIRNTMSARDEGNVQAFKKLSNGKYDLDQWNETYWDRFQNLLKWTAERDIIIQIELWDQWDHIGEEWNTNPWNPEQNVNYDGTETQLGGKGSYNKVHHKNSNKHAFFLTIPEINNDLTVLDYQKKFVARVLSYSLRYNHVLYTITNELFDQHPVEWSLFWIDFVNKKAQETGKSVYITEMFQEPHIDEGDHRYALNQPETFDFVDMSQNAAQSNQTHWDKLQWVREYTTDNPRPINHTKIYGGDEVSWTGGDEHGVERFWRNIIGGAASARFHRPGWGIGLSSKAQTQIRSARMLLSEFNIFEAAPDVNSDKLRERSADEAYLSYIPAKQYAVYFPAEGNIQLDLSKTKGQFKVKWLDIQSSAWSSTTRVKAGKMISLQTPGTGNWVVLLTHQEN